MKSTIINIFKAISLGMGVAAVVLSSMNRLDFNSGMTMMGLGLTCLAIASLNEDRK